MTELRNIPAEQALLGAIFINNDTLFHVGALKSEHFAEPVHQRIFEAVSAMRRDGVVADPLTLKTRFDEDDTLKDIGGSEYLARLTGAAIGIINAPDYADLVVELAQRRAVIEACQLAQEALESVDVKTEEVAESLLREVERAFAETSIRLRNSYDVAAEILEDMKTCKAPISTGLIKLDAAMGGGLYPGRSYGFAARKKVGKTVMAGTISYNLAEAGHKHLFIAAEMGPKEIHQRNLARALNVNPFAFRGDAKDRDSFKLRVANAVRQDKRNAIYLNAPGLTFDQLRQNVLIALHRHKITGFILDYWQLVGGKTRAQNTAEHLDEVAQWIADFCRKHDLWSVTMAQINQEGNTRGGEGLRLACDQVYQIHRPDVTLPDVWVEMMDTRYTEWNNIGSETQAGLYMMPQGPYFKEA